MRLALAAALAAAAATAAHAAPATSLPCRGADLAGTFTHIPNSEGAGQTSYRLRLRNTSTRACFVSGIPSLRLLGRRGRALPTHVRPARPGIATAVRVDLAPGAAATATARFSPDVPGPGEPTAGRSCERPAYRVRVTPPPGGGTLLAPVRPPTPVCEHGSMELSLLTRA
jgi:hypothetical protein